MKRKTRIILIIVLMLTPFAGLGIVFGANFVPFMYEITDLGTLGGLSSVALDINEQGQVVGSADISSGGRFAYIWEDGVMTNISESLGTGEAWGINNLSQVAGYVGNGNIGSSFLWDDGVTTLMNRRTKGGTLIPASPSKINDSTQAVGISVFIDTGGEQHAYLWESGVLNDLGTLGGIRSIAWDINNFGQVVGSSFTLSKEHAFLWTDGKMIDLGTFGGAFSKALGVNDKLQIVGKAAKADSTVQAFLWENGVMTDLGAIGEFEITSGANDINNLGQVILTGDFVDYLYDPTWGLLQLQNMLLPDNGWSDIRVNAINDQGQIVGWRFHNGFARAFIMTPVPAIPTMSVYGIIVFALLILIFGAIVLRRSQRLTEV